MSRTITINERQMAAVFAEWDRRFRDNPSEFIDFAEHLLKGDAITYGDMASAYFITLFDEVIK